MTVNGCLGICSSRVENIPIHHFVLVEKQPMRGFIVTQNAPQERRVLLTSVFFRLYSIVGCLTGCLGYFQVDLVSMSTFCLTLMLLDVSTLMMSWVNLNQEGMLSFDLLAVKRNSLRPEFSY